MNKIILTTLLSSSFFVLNSLTHIYAQTIDEKPIKHELARMPEQASWTVERWNINDVDFELKEISKETNNQPAMFELEVEVPTKGTSKLKNPIVEYFIKDKINTKIVLKNKLVYFTQITQKLSRNYWNIKDLQIRDLNGKLVRIIKKSSDNYLDYSKTDFYKPFVLVKENFYRGLVKYQNQEYLIYKQNIEDFKYNSEWKVLEDEYNLARASNSEGDLDRKLLATLPKIEELIDPSVQHVLLVDKKTMLPAYYCDRLSVYKYIYPTAEELAEFKMPEPPDNIKQTLQWYVNNVLPELERRAQKEKN